jgi:hypothetical protein
VDLFLAISQGVGLALACGLGAAAFVAAPLPGRRPAPVLALLAVVSGALVFAWSLADEDYASAPGFVAGAVCALVGWAAASAFLGGVRSRLQARQVSPAGLTFFAVLAAACLAAIAFLLSPLSFVALVFCAWVLAQRRKRAGEKYQGLRILR